MTQRSYFWTDGVGGDAAYSPYNAEEFNQFHLIPVVGEDVDTAYVVPAYLDDLTPLSAGTTTHAITIKTGAAVLNNYLYVSDSSVTLPITRPTSGYQRRDIVVLRYSQVDGKPKIRLAVIEGAEVVYPAINNLDTPQEPVLTQTSAIYEVALAGVHVTSARTSIPDAYVDDRRKFLMTEHIKHLYGGLTGNLIRNSEFLHFSDEGTFNSSPDEWYVVDQTDVDLRTASLSTGRNYYYKHGGGLNAGTIAQIISVHGSTFTLSGQLAKTISRYESTAVLRGYRKNGSESYLSKSLTFIDNYPTTPPASAWNSDFQFTITFPEDDIEILVLSLYGEDTYYNQLLLVPGYHPSPNRAVYEILASETTLPDASWTATAKSTGTTTIDLTASFSAKIKNHTKAVILRLRGRDSGSAAAASCYMNVQGYAAPFNSIYGHLEISGVTNDVWRETYAIVPVDQIYFGTGTAGARFRVNIVATGAGTFDATLEVAGIIV